MPAGAEAKVYNRSCADTRPNLTQAVTDAKNLDGDDEIRIGPGMPVIKRLALRVR